MTKDFVWQKMRKMLHKNGCVKCRIYKKELVLGDKMAKYWTMLHLQQRCHTTVRCII
jgi:hypothetical protein